MSLTWIVNLSHAGKVISTNRTNCRSGDPSEIIINALDSVYRGYAITDIGFDGASQTEQVTLAQSLQRFDVTVDKVNFFQAADGNA
jgi:hypothetical protein